MRFDWDERKRRTVKREHGIDFADVRRVFDSPVLELYDLEHSQTEDRWRLLGLLDGRVVVIIYTYRGEAIRLISARWAEPEESRHYFREMLGEMD